MFPLLPSPTFLFPPPSVNLPLNLSTSVSSANQTRCVIASCNISSGTCSEEFNFDNFLNRDSSEHAETVVKVYKSDDGKLSSRAHNSLQWILNIPLSKDCHSCNVKLQKARSENKMILQVVKTIQENDELELWFSDQILAIMEVPFLSPCNIRGEKLYVCHICGRRFEVPNPLKIHLALDCGRLKESHLWMRLQQSFKETFKAEESAIISTDISGTSPQIQKFHNIPRKILSNTETSNDTKNTSDNMSSTAENRSRMPDKLSAFKPYSDRSNIFNGLRSSIVSHVPLNYIFLSDSIAHNNFPISDIQSIPNPSIQYSQEGALELETLVSNLGRSKQGHLCIYCGKIYSRKYGLKIHIRTHTGYKPLKCKYCLRPFGDPSNLNKHVRLHAEGATPYKCDLCGKILVRRRDLDRHLKSRHAAIRGQHSFQGICSSSATMISNSPLQ